MTPRLIIGIVIAFCATSVWGQVLIPMTNHWKYWDRGSLDQTGWHEAAYDDSGWGSGPGLLYLESSGRLPYRGTPLAPGANSYYFRTHFTITQAPPGLVLVFSNLVDDAAIFFLNGRLVRAVRMVANSSPDNYAAPANLPVPAGEALAFEGMTLLSSSLTNLIAGDNVLAVQVFNYPNYHPDDPDYVFGTILRALYPGQPPYFVEPPPGVVAYAGETPTLAVSTGGDTPIFFQWHGPDGPVPGGTNGTLILPPVQPAQAGDYWVEASNAAGSVTSTVARLVVAPLPGGTLQLALPALIGEGALSTTGSVRIASPALTSLKVNLTYAPTNRIFGPASVTIPEGQAHAPVVIRGWPNLVADEPALVQVTASRTGWGTGTAVVGVIDDDTAYASLSPSATELVEGAAPGATFTLTAGPGSTREMEFLLHTDPPGQLQMPASIRLAMGTNQTNFTVSLADNSVAEYPRTIRLIARGPGGLTSSANITLRDDDFVGLQPTITQGSLATNEPLRVTVNALQPDGQRQSRANPTGLVLVAESPDGQVPLNTPGPFRLTDGTWSGEVSIPVAADMVRLRVVGQGNRSEPFRVIAGSTVPEVPVTGRRLPVTVGDLVIDKQTGITFATARAGNDGTANSLLWINPSTATVTNQRPAGHDPGLIAPAINGAFLHLTGSNQTTIRRFDLASGTIGREFAVGDAPDGTPYRVTDFTSIVASTDSVVTVCRSAADWPGGVRGFRAGVLAYTNYLTLADAFAIEAGSIIGALWISTGTNLHRVLLPPPMGVNNGTVVTRLGALNGRADDLHLRADRLYANSGRRFNTSLTPTGVYPLPAGLAGPVDEDATNGRVHYIVPDGGQRWRMLAFDQTTFRLLAQAVTPDLNGVPRRFLRWGPEGLCLVTSTGEAWFFDAPLLAKRIQCNLVVRCTVDAQRARSDLPVTCTISISNAGPSEATLIGLTNQTAAGTTVVGLAPETGGVLLDGAGFRWYPDRLAAGARTSLKATFLLNGPGPFTNTCSVGSLEPESSPTDNSGFCVIEPRLPTPEPGRWDELPMEATAMVYDAARNRMLISQRFLRRLAVVDPDSGAVERYVPLGYQPGALAISADSQWLWVAGNDTGLVSRLDLATLNPAGQFALGFDTDSGSSRAHYAAALHPLPDEPLGIAIVRAYLPIPDGAPIVTRGMIAYSNTTARPATIIGTSFSEARVVAPGLVPGEILSLTADQLQRIAVGPAGLSITAATNVPSGLRGLVSVQNRVAVFGSGAIAEPNLRPAGALNFDTTVSSMVIDPAVARLFALTSGPSGGAIARAFDLGTQAALGNVALTNLPAGAGRIALWGTNRLAVPVGTDSLRILTVPWRLDASSADLAVNLAVSAPPPAGPKRRSITVTVTNIGGRDSGPFIVTNSVRPFHLLTGTTSDADCEVLPDRVICRGTNLPAGGARVYQFSLDFTNQQAAVWNTVLTGGFNEPWSDNNAGAALILPENHGAPGTISYGDVGANDVAGQAQSDEIIVSLAPDDAYPGGRLLRLDPNTGVLSPVPLKAPAITHLASSTDGARLWAAAGNAILEFQPPVRPEYAVIPLGEELPGQPHTEPVLAVPPAGHRELAVITRAGALHTRVIADGAVLPGSFVQPYYTGSGRYPLFGDDSATLFLGYGFFALRLDDRGVQSTPIAAPATPIGIPQAYVHGRLYSPGQVFDTRTLTRASAPAELMDQMVMAVEPAADRAYALARNQYGWVLHAYAAATMTPLTSLPVVGLRGSARRLVRWGTNGLAFATDAGQIGFVRAPLFATQASNDLAISISPVGATLDLNEVYPFEVVITNHGTSSTEVATALLRSENGGMEWQNVPTVPVSWSSAIGGVRLNLGPIGPGQQARAVIHGVPRRLGPVRLTVQAGSSTFDSNAANDTATTNLTIVARLASTGIGAYDLPGAIDLVADSLRGLLYVATTNGVIVVDPHSTLLRPVLVPGLNCHRLALTGDRRFLWLTHDSNQVGRIDLDQGLVDRDYRLALAGFGTAILALPGDNASVMVADSAARAAWRITGEGVSKATGEIVTNGNYFPQTAHLAIGTETNVVYAVAEGYLSRYRLGTELVLDDRSYIFRTPPDVAGIVNGALLDSSGRFLDVDTGANVGNLAQTAVDSIVTVDSDGNRLLATGRANGALELKSFDLITRIETKSLILSNFYATALALCRWGADGVALLDNSNRLTLIRSPVTASGPPADLALAVETPAFVRSNLATVRLMVTNQGPNAATNLVITARIPEFTRFVSATGALGSASFATGRFTWMGASLPVGGRAELELRIIPDGLGPLPLTASVVADNADPQPSNNVARGSGLISGPFPQGTSLPLTFRIRDQAYDPLRGRLLVSSAQSDSVHGDAIIELDPVSGEIVRQMPLPVPATALAISDDSARLWIALNRLDEVAGIDLESWRMVSRFPVGTNRQGAIRAIQQLLPLREDPNRVLVRAARVLGRLNQPSMGIYQAGVRLPADLEFSGDAHQLDNGDILAVDRIALRLVPEANGLREIGRSPFPSSAWGSPGVVIGPLWQPVNGDVGSIPQLRAVGLSPLANPGAIARAPDGQRLLHASASQNGAVVKVAEGVSGSRLAEFTLGPANDLPVDLQPWHSDGVSVLVKSGSAWLARNSLIEPVGLADLGVAVTGPARANAPGRFPITITVTNRGPEAATGVKLAWLPPAETVLVNYVPATPAWQHGSILLLPIESLPPRAGFTTTVTVETTTAAWLTNYFFVGAATFDPNPADGAAGLVTSTVVGPAPDTYTRLNARANSVVYDPHRDRVLVSRSDRASVAVLNPETGEIMDDIAVDRIWTRLALSADGVYLYGISGERSISRLRLTDRVVDLSFSTHGLLPVARITTLAGAPHTVVVTRRNAGHNTTEPVISVYDDAQARPIDYLQESEVDTIRASLAGDAVYALTYFRGLHRLAVTPLGLTPAAEMVPLPPGTAGNFSVSETNLWVIGGPVLDSRTMGLHQILSYPPDGTSSGCAIDLFARRYYIELASGRMFAWNIDSGQPAGETGVPAISPTVFIPVLVHCGGNRFVSQRNGELFLRRASIAPGADLAVHHAVQPLSPAPTGTTGLLSLIVSNLGPSTARGRLTQNLEPGLELGSATVSQGTIATNGSSVTADVGDLPAGAFATVNLSVVAPPGVSRWLGYTSEVSSLNTYDPVAANNRQTGRWLVIQDRDGNGLPDEWEEFHFNRIGVDPGADPDGDGTGTGGEFLAGTPPTEPGQPLRLARARVAAGSLVVEYQPATGRTCQLQRAFSIDGPWAVVGTSGPGALLPITLRLPVESRAFYRLLQLP